MGTEITPNQRALAVMAVFKEPVKVWVSKKLLASMTPQRRVDAYDCIGVHSVRKILDKAGVKLGKYDSLAWGIHRGGIKFRDTNIIGDCKPEIYLCLAVQNNICIPRIKEPRYITIELVDCYV